MNNPLKEKVSFLSNNLAVTEEDLMEALLLNKPEAIDIDLYLAIQAVMIHVTRESPRVIDNFLKTVLFRVDFSDGFELTMYRIFHHYSKLGKGENPLSAIEYIGETFGNYMVHKAVALIHNIDLIEEYKYKIA